MQKAFDKPSRAIIKRGNKDMKTLYMTKENAKKHDLSRFPNAGPGASISGMKKQFWGENALVIKSGQYIYNVDSSVYYSGDAA